MLRRAAGASPRFELVDIHAALHSGETGEALRQKLRKALETCYTVFGPERTTKTKARAPSRWDGAHVLPMYSKPLEKRLHLGQRCSHGSGLLGTAAVL